jgi:hypothetical protein
MRLTLALVLIFACCLVFTNAYRPYFKNRRINKPASDIGRISIQPNFSTGRSSWSYSPFSDEAAAEKKKVRQSIKKLVNVLKNRLAIKKNKRVNSDAKRVNTESDIGRVTIQPNFLTGRSSWSYSPYSDSEKGRRPIGRYAKPSSDIGRISIQPNFSTGRSSWSYSPYSDSKIGRVTIQPNFLTGRSSWSYSPFSDEAAAEKKKVRQSIKKLVNVLKNRLAIKKN